jgi:hypothetical protein
VVEVLVLVPVPVLVLVAPVGSGVDSEVTCVTGGFAATAGLRGSVAVTGADVVVEGVVGTGAAMPAAGCGARR